MRRSEIRKMVSQYAAARHKHEKVPSARLARTLRDIERRYYHETGEPIAVPEKELL